MAASGLLDIFGNKGEQPQPLPGHQVAYCGGLALANAAMSLHLCEKRHGIVSEASASLLDVALWVNWKHFLAGWQGNRDAGLLRHEEWTTLRCSDGYIALTFQDKDMANLALMTGNPFLASEICSTRAKRKAHITEINQALESWSRQHTRANIARMSRELRLPVGPVLSVPELVADEQLTHRQFFEYDAGGRVFPRLPMIWNGSETPHPVDAPAQEMGSGTLPLAGCRVLDFGMITAGASASALLADLGAEVIKVEGPSYLDPFRIWVGRGAGEDWWNDSAQFRFTNRNKLGICIDLKKREGREIILDLARHCDIVVENFRVGVLNRLGISFETLRSVNPRIVLAAISSQGATGPEADSVSFGSTLEASSGLSSLIRSPSGQPLISGHALNYPDQIVSLAATAFILAAAIGRERGDGGVHLDISQRELSAFLLGEWFGCPDGLRDVARARGVEGILRSADGHWLAYYAGSPGETALEPHEIAKLAGGLPAAKAVERLRRFGVEAHVALDACGVYETYCNDDAISAFAKDPEGHPVKGVPWILGTQKPPIAHTAPTLGRDNARVIRELLGCDEENFDWLVGEGILATAPSGAGDEPADPAVRCAANIVQE